MQRMLLIQIWKFGALDFPLVPLGFRGSQPEISKPASTDKTATTSPELNNEAQVWSTLPAFRLWRCEFPKAPSRRADADSGALNSSNVSRVLEREHYLEKVHTIRARACLSHPFDFQILGLRIGRSRASGSRLADVCIVSALDCCIGPFGRFHYVMHATPI